MNSSPAACIVALIGNPNTGKSTLFSALTGVHQPTGNYPGVTVDRKVGSFHAAGRRVTVVDLPGTYSLAPKSPDEMVAVDVLLGRRNDTHRPSAVVCVVDASNLERNLYLVSQVLELGLPMVVALNMTDMAAERGVQIDAARLSARLGVPVVPLQGNKRVGVEQLKQAIATNVDRPQSVPPSPFPEAFQKEVSLLSSTLEASNQPLPRYLVERLLLDTSGYLEQSILGDKLAGQREQVDSARQRLLQAGCSVPAVEAMSRYRAIGQLLDGVVTRPREIPETFGDKLDKVLTHRLWGSLIFLSLMFIVFQAVFAWSGPVMDLIEGGIGWVGGQLAERLPEGVLRDLLVDGVVSGVGGVLVFLPQIMVLFLFIAVLEDCGYMARAAYLMDKLMSRIGLSGKSFIPLLSSFACAIPGVMSARVIENPRDRLTTILIAPLMSCSARLPVYTLLIAAFIPNLALAGGIVRLQGVVMMAMYLVGMSAAVVVALALKRTLLRGPTPPFVLELPSYQVPSIVSVVHRMLERGWDFIKNAGTLILAVSVLIWALLYYPNHRDELRAEHQTQIDRIEQQLATLPVDSAEYDTAQEQLAEIEHHIDGAQKRQSYLGRLGHAVEPVFRPLGWDWRIACAAIASFPAREVVVATLGIIYDLGGELDVAEESDRSRLGATLAAAKWEGTDRPVFNIPVALSIMVFFALCAQCAATLVVIGRETHSWRWPVFTFVYMTTLAYVAALATYQIGIRVIGDAV